MTARYKRGQVEYRKRFVGQLANWHTELEEDNTAERLHIKPYSEYPTPIINPPTSCAPAVLYRLVR